MADIKMKHPPLPALANGEQERRIAERKPFNGKVVIESNLGDRTVATVRNISPFGCNLRSDAEWLKLGRFITLRLSVERSIQAIVRWVRDGSAGVEFLRPIDLAEAEWMQRDFD